MHPWRNSKRARLKTAFSKGIAGAIPVGCILHSWESGLIQQAKDLCRRANIGSNPVECKYDLVAERLRDSFRS